MAINITPNTDSTPRLSPESMRRPASPATPVTQSSFGLYKFQQDSNVSALTSEESTIIEQELSEISALTPQQIQERIEAHERASRELYLRVKTSRKQLHERLASLSDAELQTLNIKGVYIPGRKPAEKGKMSKTAKAFKEGKNQAGKLGIAATDYQALVEKLRSGK